MESVNKLRIPLTICGFRWQLRIPQQLILTIQKSCSLIVDSTICFEFRKLSCVFCKFACFRSIFEQNFLLGISLWNPKQEKRTKISNVADSATNQLWPDAEPPCNAQHIQLVSHWISFQLSFNNEICCFLNQINKLPKNGAWPYRILKQVFSWKIFARIHNNNTIGFFW